MPKTTPASGSVQAALAALRKDGLQVGSYDDFDDLTVVGLPTGNITIDNLTGIGGFPKGRITELVGPPSSGKTTAALQCAARVQEAGGVVFFADHEKALDQDYAQALGLDVRDQSFVYSRPDSFEQGANGFRKFQELSGGAADLLIHDSVAAMTTEHELSADTGAVQVADRAKMMYQYCRQLIPLIQKTECGAIFLNHLLELVDTTPMGRRLAAQGIKRKTSPGGNAIPYYASLRVEFKQIGNIRNSEMDALTNESVDMVRQTKTQMTVIKNKVGDPFRTAELRVRFGHGFSQEYSVFSLLVAHNVIKKSGAWFEFKDPALRLDVDEPKMHGEEKVLKAMEDNREWFGLLMEKAKGIIAAQHEDAFEVGDVSGWDNPENPE
jgi:recombination protein RecA